MAERTRQSMLVHDALYKIVSLHPILVSGVIRMVDKAGFPERDIFQLLVLSLEEMRVPNSLLGLAIVSEGLC